MTAAQPSPWVHPNWLSEAEGWIASTLTDLGRLATGPVTEFRRRSWSVMLTVETDAGRCWIKQNCPSQAFEAKLLVAMSQVSPERVLTPLAVDDATGRMITADQGPTLRDRGPADEATWTGLLVDYALLQRATADVVRDPGVGLTVLAPQDAVTYLDHWIAYWRDQPADAGRMSDEIAAHLREIRPALADWSAQIVDLGLPLTVEHSDLHDNNAFAPPPERPEQPPQVFDFGDAGVACPLSSLLIPLRSFAESGLDRAGTDRVIDAYLEVWSDLASMTELRAAVPAALNLGVLGRHESWRRTVGYRDPAAPEYDNFADTPVQWLNLLGRPLD